MLRFEEVLAAVQRRTDDNSVIRSENVGRWPIDIGFSTRLTSYWAKGRAKHFPYHHCPSKECSQYYKAFPRDRIEEEFETVLRPWPDMFLPT